MATISNHSFVNGDLVISGTFNAGQGTVNIAGLGAMPMQFTANDLTLANFEQIFAGQTVQVELDDGNGTSAVTVTVPAAAPAPQPTPQPAAQASGTATLTMGPQPVQMPQFVLGVAGAQQTTQTPAPAAQTPAPAAQTPAPAAQTRSSWPLWAVAITAAILAIIGLVWVVCLDGDVEGNSADIATLDRNQDDLYGKYGTVKSRVDDHDDELDDVNDELDDVNDKLNDAKADRIAIKAQATADRNHAQSERDKLDRKIRRVSSRTSVAQRTADGAVSSIDELRRERSERPSSRRRVRSRAVTR